MEQEKRFGVIQVPDLNWPPALEIPSKKFRLFVAANITDVSTQTVSDFALAALSKGMVYFCSWGPGCERFHDIVDEVLVEDDIGEQKFAGPNTSDMVMTTWHAKDSLEDAGWGAIATWWVGAFLGVALAIAARAGTKPKLSAMTISRPVGKLLIVMAGCALLAGSLGFVLTQRGFISPPEWVSANLPQAKHARFMADWWAHNTSYAVGFFGGVILCVLQYRRRLAAQEPFVR